VRASVRSLRCRWPSCSAGSSAATCRSASRTSRTSGESAYDGSVLGPVGARTVLRVRSPDAIRRVLLSPGELGIARAYVAGDLDIDRGTVFDVLELRHTRPDLRLRPADLLAAARLLDLQHDGRGHRPSGQDAHLKQAWWAINHTSVRLEWSPAGYLSRGGRPGPAAWRSGR